MFKGISNNTKLSLELSEKFHISSLTPFFVRVAPSMQRYREVSPDILGRSDPSKAMHEAVGLTSVPIGSRVC